MPLPPGRVPLKLVAAVATAPLTSSKHRATSCKHARSLRNAIAKEAAAPSSLEAGVRID